MTKISIPQTEQEMYDLTRSYNEMRWSKSKEQISNLFDEMACEHGMIIVGKHVYRHNGQKCFQNHYVVKCPDCSMEKDRSISSPAEVSKMTQPFIHHDIVRFVPGMSTEYDMGKRFGLVTGCHNYGTEEKPNWAVDLQFLKPHEYDSETLVLTPVPCYMVSDWALENVNSMYRWIRPERMF